MICYTLQSERLGPLPIINHFIQRMGLEDVRARYIPSDARCAVPHARVLGALLRSIIVEREPIYRQEETVHTFASGSGDGLDPPTSANKSTHGFTHDACSGPMDHQKD
jgi:Domain of unknown function (DUF4277)